MKLATKLPAYQPQIEQFCHRVQDLFHPACIILHGSVARGTHTRTSDVDMIVIGNALPNNFFERSYQLNCLRDGVAPLEVVGYTLNEWEQMMEDFHLTVLEALQWGIPLYGQPLFEQWQQRFAYWKTFGLQRTGTSWSIPVALHP